MTTILLDPATGPSIGYGHVRRLAVLGQQLERQGAVVAWRWRGADTDQKALTSWGAWPVATIESTEVSAIVTDGTPYHPAEQAVPLRYAVAGTFEDIPEERRSAGLDCMFIQSADVPDLRGLPIRGGGRYILTDPTITDLADWQAGDTFSRPILVTFGGTSLGRELTIDLATNLHAAQWVVWPASYGEPPAFAPNVSLIRDPRGAEMRQAYDVCRLVIGAFGMTTWEALAAGVPGLYVSWTAAHADGYESLVQGLAVGHLGRADVFVSTAHTAYRAGIITGHQRLNPSQINADLKNVRNRLGFDGYGAERVAREIVRDIGRLS